MNTLFAVTECSYLNEGDSSILLRSNPVIHPFIHEHTSPSLISPFIGLWCSHVSTHVLIHTYAYTHVSIHSASHPDFHPSIHSLSHACVNTHTHTHTHIYTGTCPLSHAFTQPLIQKTYPPKYPFFCLSIYPPMHTFIHLST